MVRSFLSAIAPLDPQCSKYNLNYNACKDKKGYLPNNYKAANAYCGSDTLVVCVFYNGKCDPTFQPANEPYRCN